MPAMPDRPIGNRSPIEFFERLKLHALVLKPTKNTTARINSAPLVIRMALHEQSVGATDEWRTPSYVFEALGCSFDVDVASPGAERTPWIPARSFITHDSLSVEWHGFAWMNPPFGPRNGIIPWLEKFFEHANGIALVPDRTSAPWWQKYAPRADLILFTTPKIKFLDANGTPGRSPAQGTCLLAIGERGCAALVRASEHQLGILMRECKWPPIK